MKGKIKYIVLYCFECEISIELTDFTWLCSFVLFRRYGMGLTLLRTVNVNGMLLGYNLSFYLFSLTVWQTNEAVHYKIRGALLSCIKLANDCCRYVSVVVGLVLSFYILFYCNGNGYDFSCFVFTVGFSPFVSCRESYFVLLKRWEWE